MTANRCSIAGCEKDALARGWCPKHYQRWRAHGDPLGGGRQYKDPAEAFEARTRPDGECLIWTAAKTKNGYGQLVVPVRGAAGRFVACVDFMLSDGRALEVNGTFWHTDPRVYPDGPTFPAQVR